MVKQDHSHVNNIEAISDEDVNDDNDNCDDPVTLLFNDLEKDYVTEDWDPNDYDDETEEGLKGHYMKLFDDAVVGLKQLYLIHKLPCNNNAALFDLTLHMYRNVEDTCNEADDKFKKLCEMGVEASEMAAISQMHAHITTRMAEMKEIYEGPEWDPALQNFAQ